MKIINKPDKAYSWLQWPVRMRATQAGTHHMTLKFFGETLLNVQAIQDRIGENLHLTWTAEEFQWEARYWSSATDYTNHYVLAFTKYPKTLDLAHNIFAVIKNQHDPWVPHISVDKDYFLMVEDRKPTPRECELEFDEIELCLGGPNI
jgi:hypothetical protein